MKLYLVAHRNGIQESVIANTLSQAITMTGWLENDCVGVVEVGAGWRFLGC